jgi:sporulation protein YlmC with PRC-barrel domain
MKDIPLNAKVECLDGPAGKSTAVIIDPIEQKVTHFVVKGNNLPLSKRRLVPVEQVKETSQKLISLNCTKGELTKMEPFIAKRYIQKETREYPSSFYGGEGPSYMKAYVFAAETVPIEIERVPPGELAVHRGTSVKATDGWIGQVDEFLVDPASQQITHLVLREGHLWGKKELTVPMSAIERMAEDTVYLKLDKQAVEQLPPIAINRSLD